MRLLITAGGTGGHVYPALAAASKLPAAAQVLWVGSAGGMERELVTREAKGFEFKEIQAGAVVGIGWWWGAVGLAKSAWGTAQALGLIRRFKPAALLTTGGFPAIPTALAAWLSGVPILVYLPDIEPGSAVKLIARLAAKVAVTGEESRRRFPKKEVVVTGYPVRPEVARATRSEAQKHFGLVEGRRTLLVFGGSRGARSINLALLDVLGDLLNEIQIIHLSGELDWLAVKARRESLPAEQQAHYHAFPYLHDEMGLALAAADLAVSRAGASALGEFPIFGLGAILVPYPHAWRYQKVNADFLAGRGAGVRLNDEDLKMKLLPTLRELMRDPTRLAAMGAAARALAVPDAAERIAAELLALAGARP